MSQFDRIINRRGTDSFKWDGNQVLFGRGDLLPFWVADMDFATPAPILDAIRARTGHPVLGYEIRSDEYFGVLADWLRRRHDWSVPREWLMFCPPSSIVGIYGVITQFTMPGDGIVVPSPNYGPLLKLVRDTGRRLVRNPLREKNGRFVLDTEALAASVDAGTRMIIISSPHNPTGRVFTRSELEALAAVARAHDLVVVSDEVHADLVLPGHRHIPYGSIDAGRSVTVMSPNKTFNTAGLPQATLVMPDENMRAHFKAFLDTTQLNHDSTFGAVAMIAGYRDCEPWLDELIEYLAGNHWLVADYLERHVPQVRKVPAEATYLAWLDCRRLGQSEADIMRLLVDKGGVGLYGGPEFGPDGEGFFRMNIACPRDTLRQGLQGIRRALT
ncbi:MAG: PatB family C-S lyase [Gammaproteobacteria bacterium]|nr:PatB family C-S lyase [Gammaproteobacteria bacterium]